MRRLQVLLCLQILASACAGGNTLPAGPASVPSPAVPSPANAPVPRVINVGEEVNDSLTFNGDEKLYELTAPSDGMLVARVSWDSRQGYVELTVADAFFQGSPPDWSPLVGKARVAAGQKYRVIVADCCPWDYGGLFVSFALTTSIESSAGLPAQSAIGLAGRISRAMP